MSIVKKYRQMRGRISQRETGSEVSKPNDVNLTTDQAQMMLERGNVDNISVDDLKNLAEYYGKQLSVFYDDVDSVVEKKSNSKITLVADFIKVIQNADRIDEYPAIEKLVREAAKSLKD